MSIGGITFTPPGLAGPQLPEGIRFPDGVVPDEALLAAVLFYPEAMRLLPGFNDWFSRQLEQSGENAGKGLRHITEEIERALENTEEAVHAYGDFVEDQANGAGDVFDETTQRIREGKLLDAFWHASIGPLKNTE